MREGMSITLDAPNYSPDTETNKMLRIASPHRVSLETTNKKRAIIQSKIERFKPSFGTEPLYLCRYLQLTPSVLNYYK